MNDIGEIRKENGRKEEKLHLLAVHRITYPNDRVSRRLHPPDVLSQVNFNLSTPQQ